MSLRQLPPASGRWRCLHLLLQTATYLWTLDTGGASLSGHWWWFQPTPYVTTLAAAQSASSTMSWNGLGAYPPSETTCCSINNTIKAEAPMCVETEGTESGSFRNNVYYKGLRGVVYTDKQVEMHTSLFRIILTRPTIPKSQEGTIISHQPPSREVSDKMPPVLSTLTCCQQVWDKAINTRMLMKW